MFSVVIPTWNRKDDLSDAVNSVLQQKGAPFEIIIIDNGSDDGTQEYCLDLTTRDKRVRYFRFNENKGITIAENKGFLEAKGDIIFCLDDDELIEGDNLFQKVRFLADEKAWDILNIGIVNMHTGEWQDFAFSHSKKNNLHRSFYVNNFTNGTVFIKRKVIEKIGFFEEHYFRQGHENEYALRAVLNGFNILYYPELILKHKVNPFRLSTQNVYYYMLRNTLLKNYKYFSGTRLFLLQLWQMSQFCWRMFAGKISLRLMIRALKEYFALKTHTSRILDYNPVAMGRYFFVSRKVVTSPELIGQLSFFQYYIGGLTRVF